MSNMKVAMIPIVISTLETIPKGLEKRLEKMKIKETILTIQSIALLKSTRILRKVL